MNPDILFRNFDVFSQSEKSVNNFKSLIFQLALKGKLDFQKLSEGRIKQPLKFLVEEQKTYLQKKGIAFEEQTDSLWPMVELGELFDKIANGKNVNQINEKGLYRVSRIQTIADGVINLTATRWTNDEIAKDNFLKKGDILFSHINSLKHLAKTAIFDFDEKLVHGINLLRFTPNKKKIIPYFALYLFKTKFFISKACKYAKKAVNQVSINITNLKQIKIPLPPLEVQKEIIALMEKCDLLETQIKERSRKQKEFSKSTMRFITHSKNKAELTHNWKRLKDNFKDILYSENGAKNFQSMLFQLALSGRLDFQKLSNGRIKKPLQALIREQKQRLQKEGIAFQEQPNNLISNKNLGFQKLSESQDETPLKAIATEQKNHLRRNIFKEKPASVWPMVKLEDISELFRGVIYSKKDEAINGSKSILRANNIDMNSQLSLKEIKQINKENIKENQKLIQNDIFICLASGSKSHVGKVAFIEHDTEYYFGGFMGCVRGKKNIMPKYLFYLLYSKKFNKYLAEKISNTTVNNLSKKILYNYQIPLPHIEVQKEIIALMESANQLARQIHKEQTLSLQLSKTLSYFEVYQNRF